MDKQDWVFEVKLQISFGLDLIELGSKGSVSLVWLVWFGSFGLVGLVLFWFFGAQAGACAGDACRTVWPLI